jgi:ankyrin repeat protein
MNTLESATLRDDVAMLELLLAHGGNPNELNDGKMTPLSWAAIGGHPAIVKLLLAKGAKVNLTDEFGMTPLLYAAAIDFGDTSVLEQLLAAGADRTAKDEKGRTASDLAKLYRHNAHTKVLAK